VAAGAALWAVIGFLAVPPLLRSLLANNLSRTLRRRTTVERVTCNPFALSVRVRGLLVREPGSDGVFVSLRELYADLKLSSLLHLAPVLEELQLKGLHVRVVRNEDQSYNFSDLLAPNTTPASIPSKPMRYALNNIQLFDGTLDFEDRPAHKVHTVRDAYVAIPFLSNLPDDTELFVQPALRAVVNGTVFALGGRTKPFSGSRETALDVDIRDLDVPAYLEYLPVRTRAKVLSARLSTRLTLTFRQERGVPSALVLSGRAVLTAVALADTGGSELLKVPSIEVRIAAANLLAGRTSLQSVLVQKPLLHVTRDRAGAWNLASLALATRIQATLADREAKDRTFVFEVSELKVADGTILLADAAADPEFTATLHAFELDMHNFSTAPHSAARVELSLVSDAGETLHGAGELTLEPLAARGTLEIAGVTLRREAPD
jgi:uncharacterized protein involved in outer membrane biogenesis